MTRLTSPATTSMPFGDAYSVTFDVGSAATSGLQRYRFVVADQEDTTGKRPVKYPAANANAKTIIGLIGGYRVQAPATTSAGYGLGTTASPYVAGQPVAVTLRGSDLVEAAVAAGQEGAIAFGDFIVTDAAGKAVKFVSPTITPSMTATLANTAIGTTISGATADFGDTDVSEDLTITATLGGTYAAAEITAYVQEVVEDALAAEAVKIKAFLTEILPVYAGLNSTAIKAYIAEYTADYVSTGNAGFGSIVGVALGGPDGDGLVPFIFVGRA